MSALKYDKITSKTFVKDGRDREVKKLKLQTVKEKLLKICQAIGVRGMTPWKTCDNQEALNFGDENVEETETMS